MAGTPRRQMEPRRNIELKAVDPAPVRSREACVRLHATSRGQIVQRDTYFNVLHGALKLREETPGAPHLIQYDRPDEAGARQSSYRVVEVANAETTLAALTAALGVGVIVKKRRELWLLQHVRIHLDDVVGLGTFIELEARVGDDGDVDSATRLLGRLRDAFGIADEQVMAHGYAHQLERAPGEAGMVRRRLGGAGSGVT